MHTREFVLMPQLRVRLSWGARAVYAVGVLSTPLGPLYMSTIFPLATARAIARKLDADAKEVAVSGAIGRLDKERETLGRDAALARSVGLKTLCVPGDKAAPIARVYTLASLEAHGNERASACLDELAGRSESAARLVARAREDWRATTAHDPEVSGPLRGPKRATLRGARFAGEPIPPWARDVFARHGVRV